MVSSVNSTLIRPNLDILNFLSNNNDLRTMLTIHCKSLKTLTFSYTRIFSIYNNRLSSELTSPYKSLISLLKFKSSLFSMTQAGKFIHHRRNLDILENSGDSLTLNYLGEKWFNVKLPWGDSLILNYRSLQAPRVSWTLGINLSKTFPAVGPMGGPICLIYSSFLLPYIYIIAYNKLEVNLFLPQIRKNFFHFFFKLGVDLCLKRCYSLYIN